MSFEYTVLLNDSQDFSHDHARRFIRDSIVDMGISARIEDLVVLNHGRLLIVHTVNDKKWNDILELIKSQITIDINVAFSDDLPAGSKTVEWICIHRQHQLRVGYEKI